MSTNTNSNKIEAMDFIFQVYSPAIFYTSPIAASHSTSSNDCRHLHDLLNLMMSFLKHPLIAFDLYAQGVLIRLVGELYCSYSWLSMKKVDKLTHQLNYALNK